MTERADDRVLPAHRRLHRRVVEHVAFDDTQIRVLDLQPGGRAHKRCDLMAELQSLSHQLPASSAGRTDDQDVEPVSPSARNGFRGSPTFWSLARERDREREPVHNQENYDLHASNRRGCRPAATKPSLNSKFQTPTSREIATPKLQTSKEWLRFEDFGASMIDIFLGNLELGI